jgi:hypothetical protein
VALELLERSRHPSGKSAWLGTHPGGRSPERGEVGARRQRFPVMAAMRWSALPYEGGERSREVRNSSSQRNKGRTARGGAHHQNGAAAASSLLDGKGARGQVPEATTLSAGSGRGWVAP